MFKKRRFSLRRNRRRSKADVLSLSVLSGAPVSRAVGAPILSANTPFATAQVLFTGGKNTEAGFTTQQTATPLQDDAGRGAAVRGLQFDLGGFTSCWLEFGSPVAARSNTAFNILHYLALVKTEYDSDIYQTTGQVVPRWNAVPNIVASPRDQAINSGNELAFDPAEDILWRGLEEAIAFPCTTCYPCPDQAGCPTTDEEGCAVNFLGVNGIGIRGTVNSPDLRTFPSMANLYKMRHVKLRTRRFLKENECIVLVENWVAPIPENTGFLWETYMYGVAAVRIAR